MGKIGQSDRKPRGIAAWKCEAKSVVARNGICMHNRRGELEGAYEI